MPRTLLVLAAVLASLTLAGCTSTTPGTPMAASATAAKPATTTSALSSIGKKFLPRTVPIQARYDQCKQQETAASRGGACSGALTDMVLLSMDIKSQAPAGDIRDTAILLISIGELYGDSKCGNGYALPAGVGNVQDATCQINAMGLDNGWSALVKWLTIS